MITIDNYFEKIKSVDLSKLPETLRKSHEFILKVTSNGANWNTYHSSDAIKKTIDIYLQKMNEFLGKPKDNIENKRQTKKKETPFLKEIDILDPNINKNNKLKSKTKAKDDSYLPVPVERIPEELRFIKRFINLNGKTKTKDELLRFINSLQKAIVEKRIRKTSAYAEQVKFVQDKLISLYNSMKARIKIELKPETFDSLKQLTGQEKVMDSINFIKNYISLNGKTGIRKKADLLLKRITRMADKKLIPSDDPYIDELITITKNLEAFLDSPSQKSLSIEKSELNGLEGILGCACQPKIQKPKPTIMSSVDFSDLEFDTIGLRGKWYHLIGDPSPNFKGMVSGKPKLGKSTLCIEFAGYLARHHGKVLFVAKEEGLDYTLQQKLNDKDIAHPNLDVASILPESLTKYDFIFIDSVTRMGLKPEDLTKLEQAYPTKAFIYVFQTTKDGRFRGANSFQHNVDVVIDVPEKGKAVQMGRFNQGGEMNIFNEAA